MSRRCLPLLLVLSLVTLLAVALLSGCGCGRKQPAESDAAKAPTPLPHRVVRVLCYHHMTATPKTDYDVSPEDFREQLQALQTGGFQTINCQQLADYLANVKDIPEKSVIISFDDGRTSFLEVAKPVLDQFQYRAVLFINPGTVGGKGFLTWEQLKTLSSAGTEIDSHTSTHLNLTKKPKSKTMDEFRESVSSEIRAPFAEIQEQVGVAPAALAYPFGNYDDFVMSQTRDAGYRLGLSIDPGAIDNKSNPWCLPRKMIVKGTSLKTFERTLAVEPLHLIGIQPPLGTRVTARQYKLTAQLGDEGVAAELQSEGGRGNKLTVDAATRQLTMTTRLNRGANLIRIFSPGTPRREMGFIVVADVTD